MSTGGAKHLARVKRTGAEGIEPEVGEVTGANSGVTEEHESPGAFNLNRGREAVGISALRPSGAITRRGLAASRISAGRSGPLNRGEA